MRTVKVFVLTLVGSIFTIIVLELIWYLLKGPSDRSISTNIRVLIPIILIVPLNVLFNDRIVEREYFDKDFNNEKFKMILEKYKSKTIKNTEGNSEYQLPLWYSFDGKVTCEYTDGLVKMSAPTRFVRKFESNE